ncbi:Cyanobacterial phytochrome A [Planktothrix rubescens]|nr:Cyanobacterial phytochrome A [Planktothrix rubescens]
MILNNDYVQTNPELIHTQDGIQPHGLLLTLEETDLKILQVSQNAMKLYGISTTALINRPLSDFLDKQQLFQIQECLITNNFNYYNRTLAK